MPGPRSPSPIGIQPEFQASAALEIGRADAERREPRCPGCGVILAARPRADTACRSCGMLMAVRPHQRVWAGELLTPDQALLVDALQDLRTLGFRSDDAREAITQATNAEPAGAVAAWMLVRRALRRFPISASVCDAAARHLVRVGQNPYEYQAAAQRLRLAAWRREGVSSVRILTRKAVATPPGARPAPASDPGSLDTLRRAAELDPRGACPVCARQTGRILPIAEALHEAPLPCADCTHQRDAARRWGLCRCRYQPVETTKPPRRQA